MKIYIEKQGDDEFYICYEVCAKVALMFPECQDLEVGQVAEFKIERPEFLTLWSDKEKLDATEPSRKSIS